MNKDNDKYDAQSGATLRKWEKQTEKMQDNAEAAAHTLGKFLKAAAQKDIIRERMRAEMREMRNNHRDPKARDPNWSVNGGGFNYADDDYDPIVDGEVDKY
jgi:hypothetical protein